MSPRIYVPAARPTAEQVEQRRAGLRAMAEQVLVEGDPALHRSAVLLLRALDAREAAE